LASSPVIVKEQKVKEQKGQRTKRSKNKKVKEQKAGEEGIFTSFIDRLRRMADAIYMKYLTSSLDGYSRNGKSICQPTDSSVGTS
jgi:hypothetical protein